ncbi:hypothetical protein [Hymenobacter nivis]|uniref:Zinc ribbon domain-containing protein n=1 Tax=Hymenobacter nivis TaxID=1850093 RepID=A0A2Z3GJJ8_9BACT|nr:hypothetical protein [Hymenobacter nivis]AWM32461.1 hypothetical protein DDQ68_06455 [Hymenobacter nivis]
MEFNSKKLERISRFVYYLISLVLCFFLISLSNKIIDDLGLAAAPLAVEEFADQRAVAALDARKEALEAGIAALHDRNATVEKTLATAQQNYQDEKQSFDNWIKTRKTLGTPSKDQEVVDRARRLDGYYQVERAWRAQVAAREDSAAAKTKLLQKNEALAEQENQRTQARYETAAKGHELKVFLIRLLFVGPILTLGIFFFLRFRKDKFWPLYFGFTLFSLFAFFVGLVPYLPSYGGYVRYTVGIALSGGLGYYAIKRLRIYLDMKQEELKASSQERAKNVQLGAAEKALDDHFCPSCGKDFILKKWEVPVKNSPPENAMPVADFCRYCGLDLFADCYRCGHKNFVHLPFCAACGARPKLVAANETPGGGA